MTTPTELRVRRSPRLIALGLLLVVLGGLGAAALYSKLTEHRQVIATTTDVVRGQQLTAADLTVVEAPADFQGGTPASDLDSLVGQHALLDLPAGSYPESRHLGKQPLPQGTSLVGLKLPLGRLPGSQLVPGQRIQLVGLDEAKTVIVATLANLPTKVDETTWVLDVIVDENHAPQLATLAAKDEVALIAMAASQ